MKTYYLNRKTHIITDTIPSRYNLDNYIFLYGVDDSIFIDTYRIQETDQVIDFAYSSAQMQNYESLLRYHLIHHNIDIDSVYLIKKAFPRDQLIELLKIYGVEV